MALNIFESAGGDNASPVAAASASREVEVTRIGWQGQDLVYGDEIRLMELPSWPRDLRISIDEVEAGQLICRELRTKKGGPIGPGDTAVLCSFPYWTDWFSWSSFKPGFDDVLRHEGQKPVVDKAKQDLASTPLPGEFLNDLAYDPFETRRGYLTARFVAYGRTRGLRDTLRGGKRTGPGPGDLFLSNPNRSPKEGTEYWLYGVVADFEDTVAQLREASDVQRLRDNPEIVLESRGRQRALVSWKRIDFFHKLAEVVLDVSLRKALAGFPQNEGRVMIEEGFRSRRVLDLVEYLFRRSMRALAKRWDAKEVVECGFNGDTTRSPGQPELPETAEDCIEQVKATVERLLSAQTVTVAELQSIARLDLKRKDENGLWVAIALHRLNYPTPPDLLSLIKSSEAWTAEAGSIHAEIQSHAARSPQQRS